MNDINDYDEFCDVIEKMKCLKSTFDKTSKNSLPTTTSNFHKIYYQDITSHAYVTKTHENDTGIFEKL